MMGYEFCVTVCPDDEAFGRVRPYHFAERRVAK